MSRETWEMIQKLQTEDIELQLALQCAPLIAGLKISNLLIIQRDGLQGVEKILAGSHLSCYPLMLEEKKVTLFLYQRAKVEAYLAELGVKEFLAELGYRNFEFQTVLTEFQRKYIAHRQRKGEFPHEMGILLGYPVEDVRGFMEHGGKNYLCSGCWKVYADEQLKRQLFQRFEEAGERLIQLLSCGVKMADIIENFGVEKTMPQGL